LYSAKSLLSSLSESYCIDAKNKDIIVELK
jgi:hypothetical protein